MRNASCVKGLEAASIRKTGEREGREEAREQARKKRTTGVVVDGEWRRRRREKQWNEVALKLGQVYSVSMSLLIDHRYPPTTPCGSTYRWSWGEGGSRGGRARGKGEGERGGGRADKLLQQFIFICHLFCVPFALLPVVRECPRTKRIFLY